MECSEESAVPLAIRAGTTSRDQARETYLSSEEELAVWEGRLEIDGLGGLQLKNLHFRRPASDVVN